MEIFPLTGKPVLAYDLASPLWTAGFRRNGVVRFRPASWIAKRRRTS